MCGKESHFPQFLQEAHSHPSSRYWLLKTICLNNLYGLDLIPEAGGIAKLRLFLKLAAQLDDVDQIEPLPDLDFNIKTGNLLVGIAYQGDAERRFGKGKLLLSDLDEINALVAEAATVYQEFISQQIRGTHDDITATKQALADAKTHITEQLDKRLYELRVEGIRLATWQDTHQPFHWFAEFPTVWQRDGFDVIIGNPPYTRANSINDYTWQGYATQHCPDLYAMCTERASTLLNPNGRMAFIVMHSLCFSKNFQPLRDHLEQQFSTLWVSSYSRIPDSLFKGSARVRNSIILASNLKYHDREHNGGLISLVHTSQCRRWLSAARPHIFSTIEYLKGSTELMKCGSHPQWPFIDSPKVGAAFTKMVSHQAPIQEILTKQTRVKLAFKDTAQYMLGVYQTPPGYFNCHGKEISPASEKWLYFANKRHRDLALMIFAGRWGYLWWLVYGDEFDVTKGRLAAFPGNIRYLVNAVRSHDQENAIPYSRERKQNAVHQNINNSGRLLDTGTLKSLVTMLLALAQQLKIEMPQHREWKANAGARVGRYNMLKLRHITDEADYLLARAWGIENAYEAAGNLRDRMTFGNKSTERKV